MQKLYYIHGLLCNTVKPVTIHKGRNSMLIFFLFIGIIGMLFLFVFINMELNSIRKKTDDMIAGLKKHYERD
jgi:hypothetical protein